MHWFQQSIADLPNASKSRDTLIACEKTGRQARVIELDPKYCDVIVQRRQAWTGKAATLEGDRGATKRSPPGGKRRRRCCAARTACAAMVEQPMNSVDGSVKI